MVIQDLVFRAAAADLWIQPNRWSKGKKPADMIEVVLAGELYEPPLKIGVVERSKAGRSTPEKAAESNFSALKANDDEWILENFVPEEQAQVKEFLDDPDARRRSAALLERQQNELLFGRCTFQDHILLMIGVNQDRRASLVATYKKTARGWKRTNALANDETFDVLFAAVRAGQVTGRPKR